MKKAESTDSPHEAEVCFSAAQRLASLGAIDLAVARKNLTAEERNTLVQEIVDIGVPGKKGLKTFVALFTAIANSNDIKCDVLSNYSQIFLYGYDSDIKQAKLLYQSLAQYMVKQSESYLHVQKKKFGKTPAKITQRISFQMGFAARIGKRLQKSRAAAVQELSENDSGGVEIALQEKAKEVSTFYKAETTAKGRIVVGKNTNYHRLAFFAGDKAGKTVSLGGESSLIIPKSITRG